MDAHQFAFKINFLGAPELTLEDFIPVFHRFIRDGVFADDAMIDVADYIHVPDGPGVLLVCHEGHFIVQQRRGQWSLGYQRKRGGGGQSLRERMFTPLGRLLAAALELESDDGLRDKLEFETTGFGLRIQDRLHAANDAATLASIEPAVRDVVAELYPDAPVSVERTGEARELFTLAISVAAKPSIAALRERTCAALGRG